MSDSLPARRITRRRLLGYGAAGIAGAAATLRGPLATHGRPVAGELSARWTLRAPSALPAVFARATSVDRGEPVQLAVACDRDYSVEVWRTGWYGRPGLLRCVWASQGGSRDPTRNLSSERVRSDAKTGEVRCDWVTTDVLPTDGWPTGLYLVNVRAEDGRDSQTIVTVRDDGSSSDVLYIASTATWQAYNGWGGRSLYDFNSHGESTLAATPRAVAISFDRPYDNVAAPSLNWPLRTELALVTWLERLGFDVAYDDDASIGRHSASLSRHRAIVIGQHSEYWDIDARRAVEAALAQGVSLCTLSSNTCFWKVRYDEGGRRLACYKTIENGDAAADPVEPTTLWRDPAVGEPENALFGVMYIGDGGGGSLTFPLVLERSDDPLLRHVFDGASGDALHLGDGIVGWEWDGRFSNGREPAGLRVLGSSPVRGPHLWVRDLPSGTTVRFAAPPASAIAEGRGVGVYHTVAGARQRSGYVEADAHAQVTAYQHEGGGLVFAAGTNQWGLGLEPACYLGGYAGAPSDGARLRPLSQLTYNVLSAMGARATTLTAAPEIVA
jgi:hypothetical protein